MDQDRTLHFIAARPPGMDLELGRQVALSLARLATLQGCPVTYREFELLAPTLDSKTLCGVPLTDRIGVLWQSRFPQARVRAPAWPLKPGDLPALWLGPRQPDGNDSVLTVLGTLTNGALTCLDDNGLSVALQPEQACLGRLLVLELGVLAGDALHSAPVHHGSASLVQPEPASPASADSRLLNWIRRWWPSHR